MPLVEHVVFAIGSAGGIGGPPLPSGMGEPEVGSRGVRRGAGAGIPLPALSKDASQLGPHGLHPLRPGHDRGRQSHRGGPQQDRRDHAP
jgi:hypothetical protein